MEPAQLAEREVKVRTAATVAMPATAVPVVTARVDMVAWEAMRMMAARVQMRSRVQGLMVNQAVTVAKEVTAAMAATAEFQVTAATAAKAVIPETVGMVGTEPSVVRAAAEALAAAEAVVASEVVAASEVSAASAATAARGGTLGMAETAETPEAVETAASVVLAAMAQTEETAVWAETAVPVVRAVRAALVVRLCCSLQARQSLTKAPSVVEMVRSAVRVEQEGLAASGAGPETGGQQVLPALEGSADQVAWRGMPVLEDSVGLVVPQDWAVWVEAVVLVVLAVSAVTPVAEAWGGLLEQEVPQAWQAQPGLRGRKASVVPPVRAVLDLQDSVAKAELAAPAALGMAPAAWEAPVQMAPTVSRGIPERPEPLGHVAWTEPTEHGVMMVMPELRPDPAWLA